MHSLDRGVAASALIGAIVLLILGAFAWAAGYLGSPRLDGGDVTSALEYNAGGRNTGHRRAHSKGLCFTGRFTANGEGSALSTATAFKAAHYPIIGRFSLGGGNPLAGDGRNVFRSMALILKTPDGQEWRLAMDHTPIFPVANVASFIGLQRATRPDPKTRKPDPSVLEPFLVAHPEVRAFQTFMQKHVLPNSFANATYYSINAFRAIDGHGTERFIRWEFEPEAPLVGMDKKHIDRLPRDYLFDEFISRTTKQPSHWRLRLVAANPGDVTDKATVPWKGTHRTIIAGRLTVDAVEPEETGACRDLNFDPTILPQGLAVSDDPLLAARAKSYSSSFTRRGREGPRPSAVGKSFGKDAA